MAEGDLRPQQEMVRISDSKLFFFCFVFVVNCEIWLLILIVELCFSCLVIKSLKLESEFSFKIKSLSFNCNISMMLLWFATYS